MKIQKAETALPRLLQRTAKVSLNTIKWFTYASVLLFGIAKQPASAKIVSDAFRLIGKEPVPTRSNSGESGLSLDDFHVDTFWANHGFQQVLPAIKSANIKGDALDINHDGIVGSTPDELQKLITLFKGIDEKRYAEVIKIVENDKVIYLAIWGKLGPHPYKQVQAGRSNCQNMADYQALASTPSGKQIIKGTIKVTNLNDLSEGEFRIDTQVNFNGETIDVPFEMLASWMSFEDVAPSHSFEALYIPILTCAMEVASQKYGGVPSWLPSATLTLTSSKDYSNFLITSLSDNDLIHILSQAPTISTKLATSHIKWNNVKPKDLLADLEVAFDFLKPKETPVVSEEKKAEFKQNAEKTVHSITKDSLVCADPVNMEPVLRPGKTIQNSSTLATSLDGFCMPRKMTEEKLLSAHLYTVKEFKNVDGEWITTISDSHGTEFDLTLDQIRNNIFVVTTERDLAPNFNFLFILLPTGAILAIVLASNKTNKFFNPSYKNWIDKLAYFTLSKKGILDYQV